MKKNLKLLSSFLFFWAFLLLFKFGAGLHYTLLSPLGERLLPLWVVGALISLGSLIQLILDIPAGIVLDRWGYKKILTLGTLVFVLAGIALFFQFSSFYYILSIFLATIGWLFFGPGGNAYALSHATKKTAGTFMAYRDIFSSAGIVLACLLLAFIIQQSHRVIGLAIASTLFLAYLCICLSPKDLKKVKHSHHPHERTHKQRAYTFRNFFLALKRLNPASTLLIFLEFTGAIFYGIVWFVVPLIIANIPKNAKFLGLGLSMFDLAVVVIGSILCAVIDRFDKKIMVFAGLLLFSIAGLLLGFSFGLPFILFAFIATTGDEMASLPLWAWLHHLDKNHNRDGLISGLINLAEDLGWAIGPLIASLLYAFAGAQLTIALGAIPLLILLLVYEFGVRKHLVHTPFLEVPRKPHKYRHKS
ncbi:MAG TPA: MFS transporter [Candidatus Nanoarchaeia archaeon]|nr:MFS transporter [Candidatus Nanoarchaeia archaeon]